MEGAFSNIEGKLKGLAKVNLVCAYLLAIICIVFGIFVGEIAIILGICGGVIWLLIGYISSWGIYAFAEILESVKETNRTLRLGLKQDVLAEENREAQEKKARADAERMAQREREEAKRMAEQAKYERINSYWTNHAEEHKALLMKKQEAEKALAAAGNMAGAQKQQLQTLIASIDDELTKDRL